MLEKADEIIGNLETIAISVIQDDPEGEEQIELIREFDRYKGERLPRIVIRPLGSVDDGRKERLKRFEPFATRILHKPDYSADYARKVTIPEIGICLDLLTHLAIDRHGNISLCVRFDPQGDLRLGNIKDITLEQAWNSEKRQFYINRHIEQRRNELPGCDRCHYYGVPRGE